VSPAVRPASVGELDTQMELQSDRVFLGAARQLQFIGADDSRIVFRQDGEAESEPGRIDREMGDRHRHLVVRADVEAQRNHGGDHVFGWPGASRSNIAGV
jgi:hypothetical protein